MERIDVLAVMERAAREATPLAFALEIDSARTAVADVINGLCVAAAALERSDPTHLLLPNMRAVLARIGASA